MTTITTTRTERSTGPRLAAAVACAGLLCTAAALPAQAQDTGEPVRDPAYGTQPWVEHAVTDDHRSLVFSTRYNRSAEDITVRVHPSGDGETETAGVEVPFTAAPEIDGGVVDLVETRRALGEAGTGEVYYQVSIAGEDPDPAIYFEPDADLDDDVPAPPVATSYMSALTDTLMTAPDSWTRSVTVAQDTAVEYREHLSGPGDAGTPDLDPDVFVSVDVAEQPSHGTVETEAEVVHGLYGDRIVVDVTYRPEEGFTGEDTYTLQYTMDDETRVEAATVTVGDEAAAGVDADGDGVAGYRASNADWVEGEPGPEDPAPGDDEGDSGDHTVPDQVETGGEAMPLMAAGACATAAALVGAMLIGRRRARAQRRES